MLPSVNNRRNQNYNTWLPSIFDDFFNDGFMTVPSRKQFAAPATNIRETEKAYEVQIAAPGMTKEDFNVNLNEDNELVIALEKKSQPENKEEKKQGTWLRREFSYASFSQTYVIPEDVELENITAKMENGVLDIVLPKKEPVVKTPATRQINIQ